MDDSAPSTLHRLQIQCLLFTVHKQVASSAHHDLVEQHTPGFKAASYMAANKVYAELEASGLAGTPPKGKPAKMLSRLVTGEVRAVWSAQDPSDTAQGSLVFCTVHA